ncbi:MAG TPA: BrnT family toxin [Rhizomicrobium sp.]|jgi:hypothetical protein|nr:BrnT family toxin [Rhizomicrobium sp.]
MLSVASVIGFEWDEGNARKSAEKHAVSQAEAEQIFFNMPLIVAIDDRHSDIEQRFHALGRTDAGRPLHVTFALKQVATLIRVISARPMSRKERARYGEN